MSNRRSTAVFATALLFSPALLAAQTGASPDWTTAKPEILERYQALLQIDSTSGHETLVVDYLKKVLEAEGIPTQTFAMEPNRANLVARLKGNGSKQPLLIFAHTDVVGVQREKWPVDPFGAVMKDGYVWGRGSKDDKPVLTANLIVFLTLKRLNVTLDRDVIFMAESGEEADTVGVGMNYMVREHLKEIEAEFAMTEGGGATIENGKVTRVNIGTAEKLPARVRLVATGTAGHGSVPRLDNSLIHLGAAVQKVGLWETPMELNDTTRAYFEKLATISTPEKAARYNALLNGGEASGAAQAYLREHEPGLYSMLRTSVVPTMLKAGVGLNVIPSEAEATLDIRAVPGENLDEFFNKMGKVIDDPAVKIVPLPRMRPPSPASHLDNEMFKVMSKAAQTIYPGAVILPSMSTGASDNSQLRAIGIQSYGVGPASTEDDSLHYPAHGDVERLAESSLYPFVQYVWTVVTGIAAKN
jgi:acetylornithine deacetylase/succinyl-diaminopimelate desuccinylase-like protein